MKIAIPISDETPGSSSPGCGDSGDLNRFNLGLNSALENEVIVFGFSGLACGTVYAGSGCSSIPIPNEFCTCSKTTVRDWMNDISNKTGGKMYSISDVSEVIEAIEEIITNVKPRRIPYLEAGTLVPSFKDINSVTIPIPVTAMGKYVELEVYYWS